MRRVRLELGLGLRLRLGLGLGLGLGLRLGGLELGRGLRQGGEVVGWGRVLRQGLVDSSPRCTRSLISRSLVSMTKPVVGTCGTREGGCG